MYKRIVVLLLIGLFTFSSSAYADGINFEPCNEAISYSSSFGVSSEKTYKVKVTFTENKNGNETKASVWSNAA